MASHAYTTPTRRRALFAAVGLAMFGTGVATATAAAVVDWASEPDAELISLCARFDEIERRYFALCRGGDDAIERALDAMEAAHASLIEQIVALPPTTLNGAAALAATLENWTHGDFADGDLSDERLCRTLLEGLARLAPAAPPAAALPAHPDAELLTLGKQLEQGWAAHRAWEAAEGDTADDDTYEASFHPCNALIARIEHLRARTLAGLRVKALAVSWCGNGEEIGREKFGDATNARIAAGIVRDLLEVA